MPPAISFDFNFWTVLLFSLNFGLSVFALISSRSNASQQKIQLLEVKIATLEANQANAIKHDDLSAVYRRLDDVAQTVNTIKGQLEIMVKKG